MNTELLTKGILITYESMGVKIVKISEDEKIIYLLIPKVTNDEKFPTGELLAKRLQETWDEMFGNKRVVKLKYKLY